MRSGCHRVVISGNGSLVVVTLILSSALGRVMNILVHSSVGNSGSLGINSHGRHKVYSSNTSVAMVMYPTLSPKRTR